MTPPLSILLAVALCPGSPVWSLESKEASGIQHLLPCPASTCPHYLSFPGTPQAPSASPQHHTTRSPLQGASLVPQPGHEISKAICGVPTPWSGLGIKPRRGHLGRCRALALQMLPVAPFVIMEKRDLNVLPTNGPNTGSRVRETLVVACGLGKSLPPQERTCPSL